MQQYLFNVSAIWLLSLAFFDVFLRRENYHAYNRTYLIVTLLCGALMPLVELSWGGVATPSGDASVWNVSAERISIARQTVVAASTPDNAISWTQGLIIIYACGALVAAGLLFADVLKTINLYRLGSKSADGSWTVIETGKEHAPFSFRNKLFVNSRSDYSHAEWQMLLAHEQRHTTLYHLADLLLLQLVRIVFWFHPLVYVYGKRLLLVHEYQADSTATESRQEYGKFLLEQSLLSAAPVITHSFNRSPIRKRITMLTQKSTKTARLKMLLLVPVVAIAAGCFTKDAKVESAGFERDGNKVIYNGRSFILSEAQPDTVMVFDPIAEEEVTTVINTHQIPIAVDDNPIYKAGDVASAPDTKALVAYLMDNLKDVITTYRDSNILTYSIDLRDIVISEDGNVIYYSFEGIHCNTIGNVRRTLSSDDAQTRVDSVLLHTPAMPPATKEGVAVPVLYDIALSRYPVVIRDGAATWQE